MTDTAAPGNDFGAFAPHYTQRARVQQRAAAQLFELLGIGPHDAVLDLACGPGHLTAKIRELTDGPVTGLDLSAGMIAEARRAYGNLDIEFVVGEAAGLKAEATYDRIFCNSALQWMRPAEPVLAACARALRPGGRMAAQAPATARFSPNFERAMERVAKDPATGPAFARFQSPWLLLEGAQEYRRLFESAGFTVPVARMEMVMAGYSAEEALGIFDSGAAMGYLNPACYPVPLPDDYAANVRRIVYDSLTEQATDGRVDLMFHRVYVLAEEAVADRPGCPSTGRPATRRRFPSAPRPYGVRASGRGWSWRCTDRMRGASRLGPMRRFARITRCRRAAVAARVGISAPPMSRRTFSSRPGRCSRSYAAMTWADVPWVLAAITRAACAGFSARKSTAANHARIRSAT